MIEKVADDSFRLMYLPRLILTLFCVVLLTMSGCGDGERQQRQDDRLAMDFQ